MVESIKILQNLACLLPLGKGNDHQPVKTLLENPESLFPFQGVTDILQFR